jgi:hypothetical protein
MRAFGFMSVSGRSLVPNPAAKIMAFIRECLKCAEMPKVPKVKK